MLIGVIADDLIGANDTAFTPPMGGSSASLATAQLLGIPNDRLPQHPACSGALLLWCSRWGVGG